MASSGNNKSADSFIIRYLLKKKEEIRVCPYRTHLMDSQKSIIIDCRDCTIGNSGLHDPTCRQNIFHILIREPVVDRLVLSYLYERDYEAGSLQMLYKLSKFIDNLEVFRGAEVPAGCGKCFEKRTDFINRVLDITPNDPVYAYRMLSNGEMNADHCSQENHCKSDFAQLISRMADCARDLILDTDHSTSRFPYEKVIRPYTRPRFSTSRIYTEPPDNAVFMEGYEVARSGGRTMEVSIYRLNDRPESRYFVLPPEYNLRPDELKLLESVRLRLMRHRPEDLNFANPANSREYFRRRSQQFLLEAAKKLDLQLNPDQIRLFSDILAKYTTGLGILEDVLSDGRVTDIYIKTH